MEQIQRQLIGLLKCLTKVPTANPDQIWLILKKNLFRGSKLGRELASIRLLDFPLNFDEQILRKYV